jgi:hypothetical protein
MLRWSDISFAPTSRTLRQFAGLWITFFGGLALWQGFGHDRITLALVLTGLAVTIGPLGLMKPRLIRPIFVVWMILAFPVGWMLSHVLLGCLFYGILTPIGFFFRLIGRDVLVRRFRPEAASYWTPKPAAGDVRGYFRPF